MSIQKQKLTKVAVQIQKNLETLCQLSLSKKQLIKKLNYRIQKLFKTISHYPTISYRQLSNLFTPSCAKLLIQNKKYMTVQDLCKYLGVTDCSKVDSQFMKGKDKVVVMQCRYQLEDILDSEVVAMENIRQAFKITSFDAVFSQIDFFNNGYIDATSLSQFVTHYTEPLTQNKQSIRQQQIYNQEGDGKQSPKFRNDNKNELQCMQVIKYLKCSATAQKIFYTDFTSILQETEESQNPQQSTIPNNNSLSISRSAGHIAKVSEIEGLHNKHKRQHMANDQNTLNSYSHHYENENHNINHNQSGHLKSGSSLFKNSNQFFGRNFKLEGDDRNFIKGAVSVEDIQRITKMMEYQQRVLGYQESICANHSRNVKYLERIKSQTNTTNLNPSKSPSKIHLKVSPPIITRNATQKYLHSYQAMPEQREPLKGSMKPSQIVYHLKFMAQIYERHRQQIVKFIQENKQFSFVNGFNVIDYRDQGFISFKELKEFIMEVGIIVSESKIRNFFLMLAQPRKQSNNVSSDSCTQLPQQFIHEMENNVIYYSKFVIKIFKLRSIENTYKCCRKRKSLIYQQWAQQQKKNYCKFIRNIISIFDQLQNSKLVMKRMLGFPEVINAAQSQDYVQRLEQKIEQIFEQRDIHYEKMREKLGNNSQTLIAELYGEESILQSKHFFKFLYDRLL